MSKRKPLLYLQDILSSIISIEDYTKDLSFSDFSNDKKTIDAVVRNFEIIGEAARNMPEEILIKYPDLPWNKMISMRNRIMHEYFGVDLDILWKTKEEDLNSLKEQIIDILKQY